MHLSAIAYNLKKYLNFEQKSAKSAGDLKAQNFIENILEKLFSILFDHLYFTIRQPA